MWYPYGKPLRSAYVSRENEGASLGQWPLVAFNKMKVLLQAKSAYDKQKSISLTDYLITY